MGNKKLTIREYVEQEGTLARGTKPWIETIPEYDDIVAAWHDGISPRQIRRYLMTLYGVDATRSRVETYFYNRTPER